MAVDTAAAVVKELRSTYTSGRTKSFEWRVSQLEALLTIATLHETEIIQALRSDLNKPEIEAFVHEISPIAAACRFAMKELNRWMEPEKVKTSILTFPSSAEKIAEPLGVVLVISTWNYPFLLSLEPVIGAIAAGNAVVLKPSEVAPATSAVLARLLGKYMDASAVKVVEGAVPETTALLAQKWDKIFYTGDCTTDNWWQVVLQQWTNLHRARLRDNHKRLCFKTGRSSVRRAQCFLREESFGIEGFVEHYKCLPF